MAVEFITAVNKSLKRVGVIEGDAGELTTGTGTDDEFTDSPRQRDIDVCLQIWNEVIHEAYSLNAFTPEVGTATITLVADQREYGLPSDFERMAGNQHQRVLRGATNGLLLTEYRGGYLSMLRDQPVATDWTGDPRHWALSLSTDNIRVDSEPTASDIYNFNYETRIERTSTMATDTMPFSDTVTDSLVPVVAQFMSRDFKDDFDSGIFRQAMIRAIGHLTRSQRRDRYGTRR